MTAGDRMNLSKSDGPVHIVPGSTDAERAQDYRDRLRAALVPVLAIIQEAQSNGLKVGFNIGPDGFGRQQIQTVEVVKPL
jgi:hypothetical protein